MDQQTRLAAALNRLAAATGIQRTRAYDSARAERNGHGQDERLEEVIVRLESMADELWDVLSEKPKAKQPA